MVALTKMRESWFRCLVSTNDWGDCFSDAAEYGDGVRAPSAENDVSRGERGCILRFARGELGRPVGEYGGIEDIVVIERLSLVSTKKWRCFY